MSKFLLGVLVFAIVEFFCFVGWWLSSPYLDGPQLWETMDLVCAGSYSSIGTEQQKTYSVLIIKVRCGERKAIPVAIPWEDVRR